MKINRGTGVRRPLGALDDGDAFAIPGNALDLFIATNQYDSPSGGADNEFRGAVNLTTGRLDFWVADMEVLLKPNAQVIEDAGEDE